MYRLFLWQGDHSTDHVGPPIACSAVKLCDVPELEYFASVGQVDKHKAGKSY
jgi:hypothetical protein